jgi:hypothetical protein
MGGSFDTAARLAARQHGRVSWQQLVDEGVHRHAIQRWLADGRLHRVHHGVYAVGHRGRSPQADYAAAVLACGAGAVISHRAAAHLLRLLPGAAPPPEVTVPSTAGRSRAGIVIHRVRALPVADTAALQTIPITTVPRTLLDLAPRLAPALLARACHQAWVRHDCAPPMVEDLHRPQPGKKGAGKLRRALAADVTLSELEDGFLALLRRERLPLPRTNVDRHDDKVDCHWPRPDDRAAVLPLPRVARRVRAGRRSPPALESPRLHLRDVFERPQQSAAEVAALLR